MKLVLETPLTYIVRSLCNFFYIVLLGGMVVRNTDSVHVHACTMLYETHAVKHHCPTWLEKGFASNTMGFSLRGLLRCNLPICYAFCNRTTYQVQRKQFTRSHNTIYHIIYQVILLLTALNELVIITLFHLLQLLTLTASPTSNSLNNKLMVRLLRTIIQSFSNTGCLHC